MDHTLPKTLVDIIESIGNNNIYKGFRIYSQNGRTNIVINFVECSVSPCKQPSKTEDITHLKSVHSSRKRRSPANISRDTQRVKAHKEDSNFDSALNCTSLLTCSSSSDQFRPECSTPAVECKQRFNDCDSKYIDGHTEDSNMDCEINGDTKDSNLIPDCSVLNEHAEDYNVDSAELNVMEQTHLDDYCVTSEAAAKSTSTNDENDSVPACEDDSEAPEWAKCLVQQVEARLDRINALTKIKTSKNILRTDSDVT